MLLHIAEVHILLQRELVRLLARLVLVPLQYCVDCEPLAVLLGLDSDDRVQEFLFTTNKGREKVRDVSQR